MALNSYTMATSVLSNGNYPLNHGITITCPHIYVHYAQLHAHARIIRMECDEETQCSKELTVIKKLSRLATVHT